MGQTYPQDAGTPSGPAGGDLTGTYPNPTIGAQKVTLAKTADPGTGKVIGSDGAGNAAAVHPPGYEWDFAQATATVGLTVSEQDLIVGASVTYDNTKVKIVATFSGVANANTPTFRIYRDSTVVAQFCYGGTSQASRVLVCYDTPSAGAHVYKLVGLVDGGTAANGFVAGTGGTAAAGTITAPATLEVTKV